MSEACTSNGTWYEVRGNIPALRYSAAQLSGVGHTVTTHQKTQQQAVSGTAGWTGPAADEYRELMKLSGDVLSGHITAAEAIVETLTSWGDNLSWLQDENAATQRKWADAVEHEAECLLKVHDAEEKVTTAQQTLDQLSHVPGNPVGPGGVSAVKLAQDALHSAQHDLAVAKQNYADAQKTTADLYQQGVEQYEQGEQYSRSAGARLQAVVLPKAPVATPTRIHPTKSHPTPGKPVKGKPTKPKPKPTPTKPVFGINPIGIVGGVGGVGTAPTGGGTTTEPTPTPTPTPTPVTSVTTPEGTVTLADPTDGTISQTTTDGVTVVTATVGSGADEEVYTIILNADGDTTITDQFAQDGGMTTTTMEIDGGVGDTSAITLGNPTGTAWTPGTVTDSLTDANGNTSTVQQSVSNLNGDQMISSTLNTPYQPVLQPEYILKDGGLPPAIPAPPTYQTTADGIGYQGTLSGYGLTVTDSISSTLPIPAPEPGPIEHPI